MERALSVANSGVSQLKELRETVRGGERLLIRSGPS
jgi:hypothetical protein